MSTEVPDLVPELRTDFVRRVVGNESVVWSSGAAHPTVLDPVANVMLEVVDGTASVDELVLDVHEAVGLSLEGATGQVTRVVELFESAGLLTSSSSSTSAADDAIRARELFVSGSTPCSENASRLGSVTLNLRFEDQTVRVSCDSRRGARMLRDALADHYVGDAEDDAPLAFALTAPQGLHRKHRLVDRAGFVLSEGRGLDAGLHALASHLTALLAPAPGTVRVQARAIDADGRTIVCLSPLLYWQTLDEAELRRAGLRLVDRLALDIDVGTGRIVNPDMPWPSLDRLGAGPNHVGTGGTRRAAAVVAFAPDGSAAPTRAGFVARLAASGLHGSVADLLDAAIHLTDNVELRSAPPDARALIELLRGVASPGS